jgi:hypothetical protein
MRVHFARFIAGMAAMTLLAPAPMPAGESPATSWQNLKQLTAGQELEVTPLKGAPMRATFVGFSDQSITLRTRTGESALARAEVSRVRLAPPRGRKHIWIGAALGAGAGAGIGAGLGEGLTKESGGDFRGYKPAITGVSAGVGALVGALLGSMIGGRPKTVYAAK